MKLVGYACRHPDPPLREAFLALSELTVLLGPNDVGKSSLLRVVNRDLSGGHFEDADEQEVKLTGGVFYAEVTDNELWAIASTAMRTRIEHSGELGRNSRGRRPPWDDGLWRPPKYDGLDPAEPEDWISHLRGEAQGREAVLDALCDSRVVAIECAGINQQNQRVWNTYWCLQPMAYLDESVRIALEASDVPFLARKRKEGSSWHSVGFYSAVHGNAAHLHVAGAPVPIVALGPHVDLPMPAGLAAPADFATIRQAVREGISRLVDTAAHTDDVTLDGDPLPLEQRAEREAPRGWVANDKQGGLHVRRETIAAARFLSATTDRLLPDFVSDTYRVRIELNDLDTWFSDAPFDVRLRRRDTGPRIVDFPVERCADGHRLWLQLALLDALEHVGLVTTAIWESAGELFEIERDRQNIAPDDTTGIEEWEDQRYELDRRLHALLDDFVNSDYRDGWPRGELGETLKRPRKDDWSRGGPRDRRFFLVDEPESHLHPRLQRAAAAWLAGTTSERQAPCLLATHSAPFLGLAADAASYVLVTRDDDTATLQPVDPGELEQLDEIASVMGFDRGELLTLVNVWLVVEGETDKAVLDTLFASELHKAGIEVLPMHGTAKWQAVLEADALWRFTTAKVTVMFDNLPSERVIEMRQMQPHELEALARDGRESKEVKLMARLLKSAKAHGKTVEPIENGLPDILSHLDETILRDAFPRYPGHESAQAAWEKHHKGTRDKFMKDRYGIEKTPEAFRAVAGMMAERAMKPARLANVVKRCSEYAKDPRFLHAT